MSLEEYAPFSKNQNQHFHTSGHHHHHFHYSQDNIIAQTSRTPNPQYTSTSIAPPTQTQYKAQQHTSIAPQTPTTPRQQYPSTQHPSIAPPLNELPPSSSQCPQTNNSISPSSISSSTSPSNAPAVLSSPNSGTIAASNFDLRDIIAQFATQPELLKLILTSKIEEDKRKAEEAKLRVRQLDLICERERQGKNINHVDEEIHCNNDTDGGQFPTSDGSSNYASLGADSSSPVQNTSCTPRNNSTSKVQNDQCIVVCCDIPNKRKRKRREMLPVTMIIDTKEYPYIDDYLWKNNGNTTQRKTGNKSIYYKCSNSNKGCPVNKTVTEKEGGWTIKYRGHHLEECGKIKRIVQS